MLTATKAVNGNVGQRIALKYDRQRSVICKVDTNRGFEVLDVLRFVFEIAHSDFVSLKVCRSSSCTHPRLR